MANKMVMYEKTETVGIITIHHPEANNSINSQVIDALTDICNEISFDDEISVVIITGTGVGAFATGDKQNIKLLSVAEPIAKLKCPTIAAINGDAFGQGLELALACDIRIAAETARFAATQISSGIIPCDGATQRLPRLLGINKAMEMILTGEIFDAKEALLIGLVSKITPAQELLPATIEMGHKMAAQSSLALRFAKEAINKGLDLPLEQGLHLEADLYFLLQTTEDRIEGIKAFLEKRPPQFKGK